MEEVLLDDIGKVFVKYDTNTYEVRGFLLKDQLEDGVEYIEIDSKIEKDLRNICNENAGTLFVKDVGSKEFESRVISLGECPQTQEEKAIKDLKKENINLKLAIAELSEQKDKELLELKLALAEIVEGALI